MTAPYLSVVVPTNRVGGIDIVMSGLRAQTFRDFELVVADGVPGRDVREHVQGSDFPIAFAEVPDGLIRCAYCKHVNAGLAAARGEVVLLISDYSQLPPGSLELHAAHHQAGGRGIMCPHDYFRIPRMSPALAYGGPAATEADWTRYVTDIETGKLDPLMYSALEVPSDLPGPAETAAPCDAGWSGADPKLREGVGPASSFWLFHCKHESFRREDALAIGGFDERLDGTNCYQDTDFAHRLTQLRGVRWQLDPSQICRIFNPRAHFPRPKYERTPASNLELYKQSAAEGFRGVRSRFTEGGS